MGGKRGAGAVLEALAPGDGKLVLLGKLPEEGCEVLVGYKPAVGLRIVGDVRDPAIGPEIEIHPQLDTLEVKIEPGGIVLDIHQETAPLGVCGIHVLVEEGDKYSRVCLGQAQVFVFVFSDEEGYGKVVRIRGLGAGGKPKTHQGDEKKRSQ